MLKAALSRASLGARAESVVEKVRIPFIQRAAVSWSGARRDVFLVDLGLEGVFAEIPDAPALGDPVQVRFRIPGNEIPIVAACRVAWRHEPGTPPKTLPAGVGLRFEAISAADRERVREHLAEYCRRHTAARRFARHWPLPGADGGNP